MALINGMQSSFKCSLDDRAYPGAVMTSAVMTNAAKLQYGFHPEPVMIFRADGPLLPV